MEYLPIATRTASVADESIFYRTTQFALDHLYPDEYPVRSDISVVVGGDPDDPGRPDDERYSTLTGATDETGFTGFGGFGWRDDLPTFGEVDVSGRPFQDGNRPPLPSLRRMSS